MCEKGKTSSLSFAAIIAVLAVLLLLISGYPVSAKGPARSRDKSEKTEEKSRVTRSERSRSEAKNGRRDDRGSRETSRPPATAGSSRRDAPKGADRSKPRDRVAVENRNTVKVPVKDQIRDRGGFTDRNRDLPSRDRLPGARIRGSEKRMGTPPPTDSIRRDVRRGSNDLPSRGQVRRDYANLGQIWRERREIRMTPRSKPRYEHRDNIVVFHGRYPHYAYDWSPGYRYPSVYCYYYGYFPPYIPASRVIYLNRRPIFSYVYVDLPEVILRYDPDYDDDYYLRGGLHKQLSIALRNISRAWESEDADLLMRHVERGAYIDVFLSGDYEYSIDWKDYHDMTYDAMSSLETVDFDFYRVQERDNREVVAFGQHTYYDDYDDDGHYYDDGRYKKTVYVSYTLKRRGNHWYITEVSSSTHKYY